MRLPTQLMTAIINALAQPAVIGILVFAVSTGTLANPVLDNVAAGQVTIDHTPNTTTINQTSQKGIINWQSFNIGAPETTHFQQPAGGVTLNRINPAQGVSQIYGRLTATGQIILVNPAGIFFGPGSFVNVGGLIASTANISNEDFLNNYYHFAKDSAYNGSIINQGHIIAADNGLVALIGGAVSNNGMIMANMGHVVLASGDAFTMSFAGNDLIGFTVDSGVKSRAVDQNGNAMSDGVKNTGSIIANGGRIVISAKDAAGVLDNVIRMEGIAQTRTIYEHNGSIILFGDPDGGVVTLNGILDGSGFESGVKGGNVIVTGHNILLGAKAEINVSGDLGGGTVNIGGEFQGQGSLAHANAVVMESGAKILADAITHGDGGDVVLWSDYYTNVNGIISAQGGAQSGDGGNVETSSKNILNVGDVLVNTLAANGNTGEWLLDPYNITISSAATSGGAFGGGNPNIFTPTATANVLDSTINTNLGSANVTITTGGVGSGSDDGDITVDGTAAINWANSNTLTLNAYRNITLNASSTITSTSGGKLKLFSDYTGTGTGTVTNNGTLNINGNVDIYYNPSAYTSPTSYTNTGAGTLRAYMYVNSAANLQSMSTNLAGFYALSKDISAGAFTPIGTTATPFTGGFDGLNHSIDGLIVSLSSGAAGLFGAITSNNTFGNVHLANVSVASGSAFGDNTGAFAGSADGNITLTNISSSGTVSGYVTGGVIGSLNRNSGSGTLSNAWSTATVSGSNDTGGIVGAAALSTISNSYFAGTINNGSSFSTSGGILGFAAFASSVTNSYNIGTIHGGNFSSTGGIVGFATSGGTIDSSYNSGIVTGSGFVGALVGQLNNGKTLTNSFWDADTTGLTDPYGVVSGGASASNNYGGCFTGTCTATIASGFLFGGTTYANLSSAATFTTTLSGAGGTAWNLTNDPSNSAGKTWFVFQNNTRPILMMENTSSITNAHQLQMMGATLGGSYTLDNNLDFTTTTATDIWGVAFSSYDVANPSAFPSQRGFAPIGNTTTNFTGSFDGQDHTIYHLVINTPTISYVGLFGATSSAATISNIGMTNPVFYGGGYVGGIAGTNAGTISNSYVSSNTGPGTWIGGELQSTNIDIRSTSPTGSGYNVGGIAGENTGTITDSYSHVNLMGGNMGGLAGLNSGTITRSYSGSTLGDGGYGTAGGLVGVNFATGIISNSFNTGSVYAGYYSSNYGGIAAYNAGLITESYNLGIVAPGFLNGNVGGFVGFNESTGVITNSYTGGGIAYGQGQSGPFGGFVGTNAGTITNTYSYGVAYYQHNPTGIESSGFAGSNTASGVINNSFWDIGTSGVTAGYAANSGTINGLYGGCFGNTSCNPSPITNATNAGGTPLNLTLSATYTSGGPNWDMSTIWNIVGNFSYPFLRDFYSSARAISGITPSGTRYNGASIAYNSAIKDTVLTGNNGFAYFLEGNNLVSGIDNSIADGVGVLVFTTSGGAANYVTYAPTGGASILATLTSNVLTVSTSETNPLLITPITSAQIAAARNGIVNGNILYTNSGNNLTINSGYAFTTPSNTPIELLGNINTTNANITLGGEITINTASAALTTSTAGDVVINNTVNGGGNSLTINSAGTATLSTVTSLNDLTVTAASGININANVTTSGNQIYSGTITLLPASTTTFTTTGAGDITFNNDLVSNNGINFAGSGVHTNAAGQVIFNGNIGNNAVQIDSVNLTAAGGIYFNGSTISTNQGQTYNSPIHLTGTVNFTNSLLGAVDFQSTVDGPGSFTSNFYSGNFAGTNPQVVTFGGAIGAITPLTNFTLSINQSAGVTFNNTLDASGAINITAAGGFFNATSTPPNVVFNAAVGSLTIPTSLSVTSVVAFVAYTPSIMFNNSVNTSGALTLSSRCDGPICTLNGPVTLNGTVGTLANPLGSLSALGSQINLNMDYIYSNGAQTYTGPVALNSAGTTSLISNSNNITMSSTVTGNGSNTLAITNASSSSVSGVMSNLALVKNGAGTLILVNNNTYTGGTTINAGTLQIGNGGATGAITGNIANSNSLVINTANSFTYSNIISGNGSLTKSGSGTLTLSGANTYSGGTTLNAGTLAIDANSIGSPVITSGPVGTGQLIMNGGTLASAGSYNILNPYTVAGTVALDGGTSLTLSGAGTLTSGLLNVLGSTVILSGNLTGSAPINALNTGNTFLTLSRVGGNNNGYSGTITFIGYLTAGAATNSFGTGSLIFATAGAESTLSSSVGAVINNNWTVNNGGSSASLSGSLTMGPTGTGTISNGSTLYLSNSPGDTLTLSGNLSGSGTIINSNGFSPVISGNNTNFTGTFNLDTATTTIISSATNALGTGALIINNGAITTTTNTTLGNSSVTVTGNAQLAGANNISIAAPISLSSGTLFVTNTAGTVTLSGNISGSAPINKSGGGVLNISGANNSGFLGATTLSAGQLTITSLSNALGTGAGAILNLNGGTLTPLATGVVLENNYTVGGAANIATGSGYTLALNGTGTLNSGSFSVDGTFGAISLNGAISGNIPLNLSATTSGTINIGGALVNNSSYIGNVTATGSPTIGIYSPTFALGNGGTVTLAGGGLYAMTNTTIANPIIMTAGGSLRGSSGTLTLTGSMALNSGTLSIIGSSNAITLNGNISGSGGLFTQNNNGAVTFNGSNTSWSGPIQLNGTGSIVVGTALNPLGTGNISLENSAQPISSTVTSGPTVFNNNFTVSVFGGTLGGVNDMTFNGSFDINTISNGLLVSNTGTTIFNGNFTGASAFTVNAGSAVIASSTANSGFSGSTTVSGGTLRIGTAVASALGSGTLFLNGGNLQSSVTATLTNPFTLSASSTINGSSNLTLSNAGALNSGTLTITNSATTSLSGVLSSSGGITLNSSGTLNLTNSNSYTGATNITAGTLNAATFANNGSNSSIGAGTVLNIGATGVLRYTGGGAASTNRTIGLTGSGATIDASGGLLTLSGGVTGTNTNLNLIGSGSGALTGVIGTGGGTLTKAGSGTWTLGNANTYTGATSITGGTLSVGTLANGGVSSSLGATAAITPIALSGGGILSYTGAPVTMNRNLSTSTGGGTFLTTNTSNSTPFVLSGNIDNANGLTLSSRYLQATGVISGAGNLTLTSSQTSARIDLTNALNSYTGQTIATHASQNGIAVYASSIADGGVNSALGATVASTPISLNNAGLLYTGGAASSDRQITMSGVSPYVYNLGSGKLTLNGNIATNATYATFDAGANQLDLNGVISGNSTYIYFLAPANSTIRINNTANTFTGTARLTSYLYSGNVVITSLADAGVPSSLGAGTGDLFFVAGQDGPSTLVYTGGTTSTNRGISMEYYFGAEPIFTNASAGTTVTFTGGIDLGYMNFNFANMVGDVVLSGQVIGSEYARILTSGTGAGSLTINNNTNTFGGGVFLTGGILNYTSVSAINGGASALGSSDGTYGIRIGGTGILRYIGSSPATTNRSITLTSSGGTLENASSSALTFSGNVTGNTFGLNLSGTGNSTLSGIIGTTTGGLTKSGSGTWTLGNAANTYTGATSITGGILSIGTLANGGVNSSLGATAAGTAIAISGDGVLSYTGSSISTDRQFATSGTGGTIQTTTASTLTLAGGINNAGSNLTFNTTNSGGNITASNATNSISGTGSLTKSGTGTLTLSGLNSYTGATFINNGTLVASNANSLGSGATQSSSTTIASGATLSLQTSLSNTNQITLSGTGNGSLSALVNTTFTQRTLSNPLVLAGNTTIGGSFGELILTGNITESSVGSILTKTGSSVIYLRGSNSYTGATQVNQGILAVTNANGLGSGLTQSNGINVTSGASLYFDAAITLNNTSTITLAGTGVAPSFGALTYASGSGGNVILNNPITLASNINIGASNGGGSDHLVLNGDISGAFSITKEGLIALDLNGNNSYSGGTTINGSSFGRIEAGHASALGTGPININSGGLLEINLNNTSLANNNTITFGSGGGYLLHNGTGSLTINNPITLNTGSSFSINALPASTNFVITNNITNNNASISVNNYTLLGAVNGNVTISGVIGNGSGSLTKAGAGTSLILTSDNTYTGGTTISGGTLQIGNGGATGSVTGAITNNGSLVFNKSNNFTLGNTISGSGSLTQNGSGAITISSANTYTGGTFITDGLIIASTSSTALSSGAVNVSSGGTLRLSSLTIANPLFLSGNGDTGTNGALVSSGISTTTGLITLTDHTTIGSDDSFSLLHLSNSSITGSGYNLTFNSAGPDLVSSAINTGTGGVAKNGTGSLTLSGNNSYSGATAINNGILIASNNNALGTSTATVTNGATLQVGNTTDIGNTIILNGAGYAGTNGALETNFTGLSTVSGNITLGSATTIGAYLNVTLALANTATITSSNFDLTINGAGTSNIASAISLGTGALNKNGTGTLTLSGTNNYSGMTSINSGTLQVGNGGATGTLGSGNVTNNSTLSFNRNNTTTVTNTISGTGSLVNAGTGTTILSANNNYSGATNINAGTLQVGDASTTGTLGTGTVTNNGALVVNRSNDITIANLINGGGTLTKNGAGILVLSGNNNFSGGTILNTGTLSVDHNNALGTNTLNMNGGTLTQNTSGRSIANNILLSAASSVIDNNNGVFTLGGSINGASSGANSLTLNGSGTTTLNGAVGGTSLSSLTANSDINVGGGSITTTGNQSYQNVALANDTTFTSTGTGSGSKTIDFAGNISGGQNVNIAGTGADNYQFNINDINANTVSVTGGAGNNSLSLDTGDTQNFVVSSANGGGISGIASVAGTFNYSGIGSLTGGSGNDAFTLNGGTLSGSVNGGAGTNSLTADNAVNTWNTSGTNSGTVTGVTGGFTNIQNIIGGALADTFNLAGSMSGNINGGSGADIFNILPGFTYAGTLDGGDIASMNEINFDNFTNMLILRLGMPVGGEINTGDITDENDNAIVSFASVQFSQGNGLSYVYFPNDPNLTYQYNGVNGLNWVADPFFFSGWILGNPPPPQVQALLGPAAPPPVIPNVAAIVNQPIYNASNNNNYGPPSNQNTSDGGTDTYSFYDVTTGNESVVINQTYTAPLLNTTNVQMGATCMRAAY